MNAPFQTETIPDPPKPAQGAREAASHPGVRAIQEPETLAGLRPLCLDAEARITRLTRREHEVFMLVTRGLTNKHVALALACSPRTVEIHRAHLMLKLCADSTASLVRLAIYAGLADMVRRTDDERDSRNDHNGSEGNIGIACWVLVSAGCLI